MAYYKWTYIFGAQKAGWSESWYWQTESLSSAIDNARIFGNKRMRLLGAGSRLEAVKVSDVAVPGDSSLYQFTDDDLADNTVEYGADTDTPWNAIYCRVEATKDYHRAFHLRGVPDNAITFNQTAQRWVGSNALFAQEFKKVVDWMKRPPGVMLRAVSKDATVNPLHKVQLVTRLSPTRVQIRTPGNHGFSDGDYVRIRYLKFGGQSLSGRRQAIVTAGFTQTFEIDVTTLEGTPDLRPDKATVRKEQIIYQPITDVVLTRAAKKSTGRAFFSPVGRRKARK